MNDVQKDSSVIGRVVRPGKSALDRRWATAWAAQLHLRSGSIRCLVEDVSAYGARLRVAAGVGAAADEEASLACAKYAPIPVRIAWRRDDWIGVQFYDR